MANRVGTAEVSGASSQFRKIHCILLLFGFAVVAPATNAALGQLKQLPKAPPPHVAPPHHVSPPPPPPPPPPPRITPPANNGVNPPVNTRVYPPTGGGTDRGGGGLDRVTEGFQVASQNMGRNGLPAGPAPGAVAVPAGQTVADQNLGDTFRQQQSTADSDERAAAAVQVGSGA